MIDVTVKIENADRIIAALDKVTKKVQRKVISAGCRAGAKLIQTNAKTRAPRKSGLLAKAIRVRVSKRVGNRKKKRGEVAVNAQIGKGDFKGETFYGAFQEFGWHSGKRAGKQHLKKGGIEDQRKFIAGKHFMEQAYKAQASSALSAMSRTIVDGLEQAVREEAVR